MANHDVRQTTVPVLFRTAGWSSSKTVLLSCAVLLLSSVCNANTNDASRVDAPIFGVWMPEVQYRELHPPRLRIAVWPDGQVAFSWPLSSFSSNRLRWGSLSSDALARFKKAIIATGVFNLSRTRYIFFDAGDMRMLVNIDGQETELRWDEEGGGDASSFSATEGEYRQFKEVWTKLNDVVTSYLPTNAVVVLDREWKRRNPEKPVEVPATVGGVLNVWISIVDTNVTYSLGKGPVSLRDVTTSVEKLAKNDPSQTVHVIADEKTPMASLFNLYKSIHAGGLMLIVVSVSRSSGSSTESHVLGGVTMDMDDVHGAESQTIKNNQPTNAPDRERSPMRSEIKTESPWATK